MEEMLYKFPDYNLLERENIEDNIDSIYKKQEKLHKNIKQQAKNKKIKRKIVRQ